MTTDNQDSDRGDDFQPDPADVAREADEQNLAAILAASKADKLAEEAENAKVAAGDPDAVKDAVDKTGEDAKAVEDKAAEDVAAAEKDKEKGKGKEPAIPLSRHKQILEEARSRAQAAEDRLEAASRSGKVAQASEDTAKDEARVTELEDKYTKHLADGEVAEATKVMREIRQLDRAISTRQRDIEISAAEERAVERVRYDTTVSSLEAAYPQIKPGDPKYDADTVKEVLELQGAFLKTGLSVTAALQRAVKYVLRPATAAQEVATDEVVEAPAGDGKAAADATRVAADRKAAAIAKGVDAAAKQPGKTADIGLDTDKAGGQPNEKSIMKMSQDDFAKLGEEELARMRGDVV